MTPPPSTSEPTLGPPMTCNPEPLTQNQITNNQETFDAAHASSDDVDDASKKKIKPKSRSKKKVSDEEAYWADLQDALDLVIEYGDNPSPAEISALFRMFRDDYDPARMGKYVETVVADGGYRLMVHLEKAWDRYGHEYGEDAA
jgi:hypothetical protein